MGAQRVGFLPHDEVMALYARAAIAVVPSIWQDPLGRTAVEALAATGCALVTINRGGLSELAGGRGIVVDASSSDALREGLVWALGRLRRDPGRFAQLQRQALGGLSFLGAGHGRPAGRDQGRIVAASRGTGAMRGP